MQKTRITSLISLWGIFTALAAGVFIMAPVAWAAPSCPLLPQNGRTIVNIGVTLVSDSKGLNETSDIGVSIPTGTYDITLVSYDNHAVEIETQPNEQWVLNMKTANGNIAGVSNSIGDLPDGQNDLTQTVNRSYYITGPIAFVKARHVQAPGSNSITAVCAVFDLVDGAPSVITNAAESIADNSAILRGAVNPNGTSQTVYWFDWGLNPSFGSKTDEKIWSQQSIEERVTGLDKGTSYYFRAAARNVTGTSYGPALSFTTTGVNATSPFVSTNPVSNIGDTFARFNGYVNPNGSSDTVRWFEWGSSSSLGTKTPDVSVGSQAISISENITGLSRGATYYVKALARNSRGTSAGNIVSFQTVSSAPSPSPSPSPSASPSPSLSPNPSPSPSPSPSSSPSPSPSPSQPIAPTVFTQVPTFIAQHTVVLNGRVRADNAVATNVWFEWGTSSSLGSQTEKRNAGYIDSADFSDSIAGLSPDTLYYFRGVAENSRARSYGAIFLFRTLPLELPETSVPHSETSPPITTSIRPVTGSHGSRVVSSFTDGLGLIAITITPSDEILQIGNTVPLRVTFESKTKDMLSDVALNITLPPELSYQTMSGSPNTLEKNAVFNISKRVITVPVGDLMAGDKGAVTIQALLNPDTPNQKIFTTMAEVTYVDTATQAGGKDHIFAVNTAINAGFAALLFAGAWWLWLLLGVLGLLLFLWLLLWWKRRKDEEEEKKK